MKTVLTSLLCSVLFPLVTLAIQQTTLKDFGGPGVKTYDGSNKSAWFSKSCKVIVSGTQKTPVVMFSVADSENVFSFWTHHESFMTSPGFNSLSATASDSMNPAPNMPQIFSNLERTEGGISDVILTKSPSTGLLESVEFNFYSQNPQHKNSSIHCVDLKLRPAKN